VRRQHPELADSLAYLVRRGRLRTLLPGVYAEAALAEVPLTRMRAAVAWDANAVLTGTAAAHLTFWGDLQVGTVSLAVRARRNPQPGFAFGKRNIPPELIPRQHGLRCTVPALTAMDLCTTHGGNAIDAAPRSRSTTLSELHEALRLTPERRGNDERRRLLLDSRDDPWSPAEREAHRLFRAAGISGWVGNYPLPLLGVVYYLDIAFPAVQLAVEIDGRAYHSDAAAFERDRWRQNDLVLAGWRVLRFTASMLELQPRVVVATVQRALN